MSTLYGVNHTLKYINVPSEKVQAKDENGKVRVAYDKYVFSAEAAVTDVIKLMKLPKGAKIVDAVVKAPSLGATGIFDLGYEANGVDAADTDGFVLSADFGGAAAVKKMSTEAGMFKELGAESQVILTCTELTAAANTKTIEVAVFYVLE